MKKSRNMSAVLTALTAFSLALSAGCSAGADGSSSSTAALESSAAKSPMSQPSQSISTEDSIQEWPEIEVWAGYTRDFAEITLVQEQWKEKLGFHVRVKNVTGDLDTALNLALASGGFKDMAVLDKNDVYNNSIIRTGFVMEVSDILTDKNYPNISSIPTRYLDVSKDAQGNHWYIPTQWDVNPDDPWPGWTRGAFLLSEKVLADVGMTKEQIKSLDDYEEFLRAAAKLNGPDGSPFIPTTYTDKAYNTVLTAFGLKTGRGAGAVASVDKVGDGFQFLYDQPNYKAAMQWLNKLVREGLMDEESVIQTSDLRNEKVLSGKYASLMGYVAFDATKEGDFYRTFNPIPFPLAEGVEKPGIQFIINPYPKSAVYISKSTKNLDAILAFMDWALEPVPERNFELNEGLVGINWNWVDEPYGAWKFDSSYEEARGNPTTRSTLQPELYMLGTMSNKWYPWWTKDQPKEAAQYINVRHTKEIFDYGTNAVIHSWDYVRSDPDTKWSKYGATLDQVVQESTAKMILAKSEGEFETIWKEFTDSLETRAHWSELKDEWHTLYEAQTAESGQW